MAGERASDSGEPGRASVSTPSWAQAVRSEKALAYVVLFVGDNPQRIYPIKTSSVLLGRADEAQVSIADASVSSQHARIVQNSQGFEIIDLDSTNGTFVAGKRTSRAQLRNGDQVTVGNVEFMFLLDRPTSATVRLPDRIVRARDEGDDVGADDCPHGVAAESVVLASGRDRMGRIGIGIGTRRTRVRRSPISCARRPRPTISSASAASSSAPSLWSVPCLGSSHCSSSPRESPRWQRSSSCRT